MTFSDQFIKILDALCDKIGITVDWTSANIMPYLQDLVQRFVKYETYTSLFWLFLGLMTVIIFLICAYKEAKKDYSDGALVSTCVAVAIVGIIMSVSQVIDIIEVNTIPEKTIMEYVKYINE